MQAIQNPCCIGIIHLAARQVGCDDDGTAAVVAFADDGVHLAQHPACGIFSAQVVQHEEGCVPELVLKTQPFLAALLFQGEDGVHQARHGDKVAAAAGRYETLQDGNRQGCLHGAHRPPEDEPRPLHQVVTQGCGIFLHCFVLFSYRQRQAARRQSLERAVAVAGVDAAGRQPICRPTIGLIGVRAAILGGLRRPSRLPRGYDSFHASGPGRHDGMYCFHALCPSTAISYYWQRGSHTLGPAW